MVGIKCFHTVNIPDIINCIMTPWSQICWAATQQNIDYNAHVFIYRAQRFIYYCAILRTYSILSLFCPLSACRGTLNLVAVCLSNFSHPDFSLPSTDILTGNLVHVYAQYFFINRKSKWKRAMMNGASFILYLCWLCVSKKMYLIYII